MLIQNLPFYISENHYLLDTRLTLTDFHELENCLMAMVKDYLPGKSKHLFLGREKKTQ